MSSTYSFPYRISGASAQLGEIISTEEWAEAARVPHRTGNGRILGGAEIERILGVKSKSWEPERFASLDTAVEVAENAMRSALIDPTDIDAVVVATCTPYEIMLDQDSFALLRRLGIPDSVPPFQLGAGCGGLARVAAHLAQIAPRRALVICYNAASPVGVTADGMIPEYGENSTHPFARTLWCSGALFSDACTALVFERDESLQGFGFYSRDSLDFGTEPGFTDPLIHYPGGGIAHPPGSPGAAELSAFGLNGPALADYYSKGMMLNQHALEEELPGLLDRVRRIYTHQAGPAMVEDFARTAGLPEGKAPRHARELGNLVTSATPVLLYTDLVNEQIDSGDLACFSVVGAGPERGAFVVEIAVAGEVARTTPLPPATVPAPVLPRSSAEPSAA